MTSSDDPLRHALTVAASSMPPNPGRAGDVMRRASRRRIAATVAAGGVAAIAVLAVALVVAGGRSPGPTVAAPSAPPTGAPVAISGVRAVQGGIAVDFIGGDPALPSASPCRDDYVAETSDGAAGELVVTIVEKPNTAAMATGEVACHDMAFERSVTVPTTRRYDVVRDAKTGRRHDVR